jgi:DNA-binding transcriptional LysR family regulator
MKRGELDDLVAFATIARTRSFTRAAAELGLSPSALSHAIRGLEMRLGVRLLARTTRSVAPTSAGERLLRSLEPALRAVETGLEALSDWRGEPSGSIRITTSQSAARLVLAPALPQFLLENPKIRSPLRSALKAGWQILFAMASMRGSGLGSKSSRT